jgi:predicted helicase/very-short-patch-repair endonuclease
MSRLLVTQYQAEVEKIIRYGGSKKETSIRNAFERLLNDYCKPRNYLLIPELDFKTKFNTTVFPDGTVKDAIRLAHGWWESKDQYDKLDEEIEKKLEKGYPDENILFEDSQTAVLIQHSREQLRVSMRDAAALDGLIGTFVDYERPEVRDFRTAIVKFKEDVPHILEALRSIIAQQEESNTQFRERRNTFLEVCRQSINPEIEIFDIHEMLIQHILTEDIFTNIFHESQFHRENNVARELSEIINTFFTGATRKNTLKSIEHYYAVIRRHSENIANHHEKQKFLKAIYENFYKAYNPKAADRLGIVYTPNEIVRFMIESADYLTHKHFGKLLSDPGVEILDPCTGTGTYVTELIEYLPADKLEHKYKNEIHCNEVAILPYYIANLNIEFTYQQKMGKYEEFKNICLVDTLDHCGFEGKQFDLFAMSVQNTARIQEQNRKTISVIIGNPPYNANQENENDDNQNRKYPEVDKRIKNTYIKQSSAQKTKNYDMYSRFFRWATDRLPTNGILAFITNSSFIDKRNFDGFRKAVSQDFSHIYVIDLGGNIYDNPKLSGTRNNVFGIKSGVAVTFLVKEEQSQSGQCQISYARRPEFDTGEEKLYFLTETKLSQISFKHINPDGKSNWLNVDKGNFESLLEIINKESKLSPVSTDLSSLFKLFSAGVSTNRDEWVYSTDLKDLKKKISFLSETYTDSLNSEEADPRIKWSETLKSKLKNKVKVALSNDTEEQFVSALYRPFCRQNYLMNSFWSDRLTDNHFEIFPDNSKGNLVICFTSPGSEKPFMVLASKNIPDLHIVGAGCGTQCLPLYRYDNNGNRIDNITDWGLEQFRSHYQPSPPQPSSPAGEEGAGKNLVPSSSPEKKEARKNPIPPSPGGRGAGGEGLSHPNGEILESGDLTHLAGARRDIPESLLQRARELRQQQTPAEKILWECLRANRLHGAKFRRQHNIGQYIVDFYCHTAKLVIELDGGIHETQKERDEDRDTWLQANGLTVLRFKNEVLTDNIQQTLETIASHLSSPIEQELDTKTHPPSPAGEGPGVRAITKLDIFHYTYAVLHHPAYRTKYELNLKREFPRLPFYKDFHQWADWGKALMDLHLNYETAEPYNLQRVDLPSSLNPFSRRRRGTKTAEIVGLESLLSTGESKIPKAKLKADKTEGKIILDTETTLEGIPAIAWDYKLGNRSALEWILDQYKEKTPKDPTIAKLFNTYKFADYKEHVIDLLQRVCTVSIKTMEIIQQMPAE